MIRNTFYFMLKALFVLETFTFLSQIFMYLEIKGLIRKLMLISKFMISLTGQQIITMHTFPNFSKSKGKQTMKFGQIIELNMRNISREKLFVFVRNTLFGDTFYLIFCMICEEKRCSRYILLSEQSILLNFQIIFSLPDLSAPWF